jgi:hypothetical protein
MMRVFRLRRWEILGAALVAVALVPACGSQESGTRTPRPSVKPGEFGTAGCFFRRQAQDFQVLDDRNLIVYAPGKSNAYHVQISPPAPELRFTNALAFESRNTQICGYAGDDLLLADGPASRQYSITGVWRLDEAALQGLKARFNLDTTPAQPEAQPVEGAEIERELGSNGDPQ